MPASPLFLPTYICRMISLLKHSGLWGCLFVLFECLPAYAHTADETYTSIWLEGKQITLIYTVPANKLATLGQTSEPEIQAPQSYIGIVLDGFSLENNHSRCNPRPVNFQHLAQAQAYQYTISYTCTHPLNQVRLRYSLFVDYAETHENFIDVHIDGNKSDFTLSQFQQAINIDATRRHKAGATPASNHAMEKPATMPDIAHFFSSGIVHILLGVDHLMFVLGLILIAMRWQSLLQLISCFTLGHSITLIAASLGMIHFNTHLIESVIALSIAYIGADNLYHLHKRRRHPASYSASTPDPFHHKQRLIGAFVFGLIHGFGFSSVLQNIGLPADTLVYALLLFNLGVEIGQIIFICASIPMLLIAWRYLSYQRVSTALSGVVLVAGLFWLVDRTMAGFSFQPV